MRTNNKLPNIPETADQQIIFNIKITQLALIQDIERNRQPLRYLILILLKAAHPINKRKNSVNLSAKFISQQIVQGSEKNCLL